MRKRKRLPGWAVVLLDVLLIAVTLNLYALVQHVIPAYRGRDGGGVSLMAEKPLPAAAETAWPEAAETTPEAVPEEAEELPEEAPETPEEAEPTWQEKFAEYFTEDVVIEESSYTSPNVAIQITRYDSQEGQHGQRWFVADIHLGDIRCFQTYMPGNTFNSTMRDMSYFYAETNALLAVNGDYASLTAGGVIIRNGVLCRDEWYDAQICTLYLDGHMECSEPEDYDAEAAMEAGAWQAWTFGPSLLDGEGHAIQDFSRIPQAIRTSNPRTVLGCYEPGHYCFVVIDGRLYGAKGFTMEETAALMEELGCTVAYNLDGGESSQMMFRGRRVNIPYRDGRPLNDILMIRDLDAQEEGQ